MAMKLSLPLLFASTFIWTLGEFFFSINTGVYLEIRYIRHVGSYRRLVTSRGFWFLPARPSRILVYRADLVDTRVCSAGGLVQFTGFQIVFQFHHEIPLSKTGFSRENTECLKDTYRKQCINLVAERDLPLLGVCPPAVTLVRLWTMMAHWHGQIWSAGEPSLSFFH